MSKPHASSSLTGLEMRIEKIERSHNSLEARLIGLTTLIRSHYHKIEPRIDNFPISDTKIHETKQETPSQKVLELDQRVNLLEKSTRAFDFQKALDKTHDQIKQSISDLKDSIKIQQQNFSEKVFAEINNFKNKIDLASINKHQVTHTRKKSDEIEKIIKELQSRLDRRSITPKKSRSESFSIPKSETSKSNLKIRKKLTKNIKKNKKKF